MVGLYRPQKVQGYTKSPYRTPIDPLKKPHIAGTLNPILLLMATIQPLGLWDSPKRTPMDPLIIGTLRVVRGRGGGDYTSLNRPYDLK